MFTRRALLIASGCLALASAAVAQVALQPSDQTPPRFITVASTTSTTDSGLFSHLLPMFRARSGIDVRIVSQGTGQALDTGRRGDADVVFVHAREQELKFVADGFGLERRPVMFNDFVLIGPAADPAGVRGSKDVAEALRKIRETRSPFVSRGDRSGTHAAEFDLWSRAGVTIAEARGAWYREIGQGMGAALNTAAAMGAYVLADRGTWLGFRNRGDLGIMVEGDQRLFNQYGVMLVSPARHAHVKQADGQAFIDWLVSQEGQNAIADYRINGEQLFFPNATQAGA
jgi:tungstate transport system substrate-binding protein